MKHGRIERGSFDWPLTNSDSSPSSSDEVEHTIPIPAASTIPKKDRVPSSVLLVHTLELTSSQGGIRLLLVRGKSVDENSPFSLTVSQISACKVSRYRRKLQTQGLKYLKHKEGPSFLRWKGIYCQGGTIQELFTRA